MTEEFVKVTVTMDGKRIGDIGRQIIRVFEMYEATPEESLLCLTELRSLIAQESSIIPVFTKVGEE